MEYGRTYFTCINPNCKYTEFPLDRLLGISPNSVGGKFEEKICWLSAHIPFEHVKSFFKDMEGIEIDEEVIRSVSEKCGYALLKKEEDSTAIEY